MYSKIDFHSTKEMQEYIEKVSELPEQEELEEAQAMSLVRGTTWQK